MSGFGVKKVVLTVAAVLLVLSLSACGAGRAGNGSFNQPSGGSSGGVDGSGAGASADGSLISEEDALQAALAHAQVSQQDVSGLRVRLEYDDGRQEYEVDFYAGGREYDYDIDALTGQVLRYDAEIDDDFHFGNSASGTGQDKAPADGSLTMEQARDIALAKVPGAGAGDVRIHLDFENGRQVFEGSIVYDLREYDFEIDAATGKILEWEEESVFD